MKIYKEYGVSSNKEANNLINNEQGIYCNAFCTISNDIMGNEAYCSILHADGAGSKPILSYLYYKETGSIEVFRGLAQDSIVMNLDDLFCVGAIDKCLISNTIARNLHRINDTILKQILDGHIDFIEKMKKLGIDIQIAGGEIEDNGDLVSILTENITCYTQIKKDRIINCHNIKAGNVIIGISSVGKASYEEKENSGIAANGLTAARHVLLSKDYGKKYPETFSTATPYENIYNGKYFMTDLLPNSFMTIGEALTCPCRIYAPILKEIILLYFDKITGIINCTGKGQTKCKGFGQNLHYIKDNLFEIPPIFQTIKNQNQIEEKELYKIFNMGHMIEIYCKEDVASDIIKIVNSFNLDAKIIGRVEENKYENKVTIKNKNSIFEY